MKTLSRSFLNRSLGLLASYLLMQVTAWADLAAWQAQVSAGTPTVTRFTAVAGATPVSLNVGTFAAGSARSFEFVFNAAGAGPSKTLMGSQAGSSGGQALKLNQFNNTQKFGLTSFGVADEAFANSPTLANQQVHAVFTSNGSVTTLYLNGVLQTATLATGLAITGTNGLGALGNVTNTGFLDNLDGSVQGFASYARALTQAEVTARYNALVAATIPPPNLAAWQGVVNAGTPTVTRFTAVAGDTPVSLNVGAFAAGSARTFEFVFNAAGAGPSKTLLGSQAGTSGGQALKLNQFNNTQKFGLTSFGVADEAFANSPTLANQQVHAVFTSNGTVTTLYLNGVQQTGTIARGLAITGTNGLGALGNTTNTGFSDNLDGSVQGFASYARALTQAEVTARYNALVTPPFPALPSPNLVAWQDTVSTGTAAATRYTSVSGISPVSVNVGSFAAGSARSFEFIFNAAGGGPSRTLLGSLDGASGGQQLKFNQFNNTQKFGITTSGQADDVFADSPTPSNLNLHAVFTSNGSATTLYLNGVQQTGTIARGLAITGTNGLGAFDNATHTTFSDNLDGTISGFASYGRALSQAEVTARFNALLSSSTVPGAPVIGTATVLNAAASVAFTAPASNGGATITSYTVTSSPSGFTGTGTGSPITVTGLTVGVSYTFTVTATNVVGTGAASAASNAIIITSTQAPTNLTLAGSTVVEGNAANATVGTLSATDPDLGDTQTFTLVSGAGSTDNGSFSILGNALRITPVTNASTKSSYTVRVRATDSGGLFFEKAFTVRVVATGVNVAKFSTSQLYITTGFNYKQVVSGNFDGDGIPDIAAITTGGDCIVLLSTQNYLTANTYNTTRASTAVAVADINGDGILDLLIGWGQYSTPYKAGVMVCLGSGSITGFNNGTGELIALPDPQFANLFPAFISVADVNADKKPDIIVQTSLETGFRSYLQNATPWDYNLVQSSDTGFTPVMRGAVAGDFNLDGILDVAHATSLGNGTSKVSVLTMYGNGEFVRNDMFTVSAEIQAISTADLDGDGRPDLAIAASNGSGGQLILARNTTPTAEFNSVPTFAAPTMANTGTAGLLGICCADMNRDGRQDVITSESDQHRVFYGNGNMTVTPSVNNPISVPSTFSPSNSMCFAADFSNDGMPDLFMGTGQLLTNLRGALFATEPISLLAGLGQPARPGVPLRIGSAPLLAGFSAASTAPWLTVTPASGFLGISSLLASGDPAALTFGKYRGKVNLTSSSLQSADVNVTLDVAAASGTLGTNQIVPIPAENNWRSPVAVGDFNNDGRLDFVNARLNNPGDFAFGFRVLLTGSGGALTAVNSSNVANPNVTLSQLIPGDYNGDGNLDVAGLSGSSGQVRLHLAYGNGAGGFGPLTSTGVQIAAGMSYDPVLQKGDFNGDGRDDLVMFHGGEATMLLGTTGGVFRTVGRPCFVRSVSSSGGRIDNVAAGDFNGDGSLDLVADSFLLLGDGQGGLRLPSLNIVSANNQLYKVQAGDFNADNITDVLYWRDDVLRVSFGSSTLNVVNSGASLSYLTDPAMVYNANAAGYSIRAACVADVNGDGILDIVSTANGSNICITLIGNGDGTFQAPKTTTATLYTGDSPLYVGDVTGDGTPDVFQLKVDGSNNWEFNRLPGQKASTTSSLVTTNLGNGLGSGVYGQVAPVSVTVSATTPAAAFNVPLGSVSLRKGATIVATTTRTTAGAWTFTPVGLGVGTHTLTAQYDGDLRSSASVSGSVTISISKANGSLAVTSSLNASQVGNPVTFTATLAPLTTGSVTFKNGATTLGTATLDSNGIATLTTNSLPAGAYSITAEFAGNADVNAATSAVLTQTVNKLPATVTLKNLLASFDNSAKSAGADTLPANLPVTFTYNGSTTAPSAVGSYTVVATVNTATFSGSASGTLVIQKGAAGILISGVNRFFDGAPKEVTVTTTPASLPFTLTYAGSSTAPSAVGSYAVVVTINSPNYEGTASDTLVISAATVTNTTLISSANPSIFLTQPTFTATVSSAVGTPSGEMQLLIENVLLEAKQVNGSGVATFTPPAEALRGGSRSIRANYNANGANVAFAPSNAVLTQTVNKAPLTVTLDGLAQTFDGTARVVTASVTPPATHPSVQVDITYDGSSIAPVNAGSYAVVATINDPSLQGTASGTLVVAKKPVEVTNTPLTFAYSGLPLQPGVLLTPAVPYTVTFDTLNGGVPAGNPTASVPINAGNYRAILSVGNNYVLSKQNLDFTITKRGVSITLSNLFAIIDGTSQYPVTAVTNPPGANLNILYTPASGGTASTTPPSTAGDWNVVATFTSPNDEGTATAVLRLRQKQATSIVISGPATEIWGRSLRYTAKVVSSTGGAFLPGSNAPQGIITFKQGTTVLGSAQLNSLGETTLTTGLPVRANPYLIKAEYSGGDEFLATTSSNTVQTTIQKATLTLTPSSPLTLLYDGQPKSVSFTTPLGRLQEFTINVTYGGSTTKPINASANPIPVVATLSDANFEGTATAQLRINPAPAVVTINSIQTTFDGNPKTVSFTTNPPNLPVTITYNGNTTPPNFPGTYTVQGQLTAPNYTAPNATGSLTISAASSNITISNTTQRYNGQPKSVTVGVDPVAPYTITYNGNTTRPTAVGVYDVNVQITGGTRFGQASAKLVITGDISANISDDTGPLLGAYPPKGGFFIEGFGIGALSELSLWSQTGPNGIPESRYSSTFTLPPGQYKLEFSLFPQSDMWGFDSWSDGVTENPRTITVGSPNGYLANSTLSVKVKRKLRLDTGPLQVGQEAVTGAGNYSMGEVATVKVIPKPGYVVQGWRRSGTMTEDASRNSFTQRINMERDSSLVADMVPGANVALKTSDAKMGTVQAVLSSKISTTLGATPWVEEQLAVPDNSNINLRKFTVRAQPKEGYILTHWSVSGANLNGAFEVPVGGVPRITGNQVEFIPSSSEVTVIGNFAKAEPSFDISIEKEGDDSVDLAVVRVGTLRWYKVKIKNIGAGKADLLQILGCRVTAMALKPSASFGDGSNIDAGGFYTFYFESLSPSEIVSPTDNDVGQFYLGKRPTNPDTTATNLGTLLSGGTASHTYSFNWEQISGNLSLGGIGFNVKAVKYRITVFVRSTQTGDVKPYSIWTQ